jgi:hypothetical protein
MQDFIKNNAIQIIIGVFYACGFFAEMIILQNDVDTIEQRLEKKIKVINKLGERISVLEKCNH